MSGFPETRPSLPPKLANADDAAWREFLRCYTGPLLEFLNRMLRLDPQDAQDVLQQALMGMVEKEKFREYDRARVRFRTLLIQELKSAAAVLRRYRERQMRDMGRTVSGDAPARDGGEEAGSESLLDLLVAPVPEFDAGESQEEVQALWKGVEEVLDVILKEGDERKREAYRAWMREFPDASDDEIARRHGLEAHQFKYLRGLVATKLRRRRNAVAGKNQQTGRGR